MLNKNHEVHVINQYSFSRPMDFISLKYLKSYKYRRYQDDELTVHDIPRISPSLYLKNIRQMNNRIISRYVNRIIDVEGIDVVVGNFLCSPPECKRVILDVCDFHSELWRERGFIEYAEEIDTIHQEYLDLGVPVVVVGKMLKESMGYKDAVIIPNGVDVDLFRTASCEDLRAQLNLGERVIGFYGNHDFIGEINLLLDAAGLLVDDDVSFLIVGRGSSLNTCKRLAKKKKLDNIHFTGLVEKQHMPAYYKLADVLLNLKKPSPFWDMACPQRIIEATASGKKVVSSKIKEVMSWDFQNITFFDYNPDDLAETIKTALNNDLVQDDKIWEFDIRTVAGEYERLITSI